MEATGDQVPNPIGSFEEAQLPQALAANTIRCNYIKPTPVQKYSIPIGLARRDLMACAQTGSGKTAAFCFPIIANILKSAQQPTGRSRKVSNPGDLGSSCIFICLTDVLQPDECPWCMMLLRDRHSQQRRCEMGH